MTRERGRLDVILGIAPGVGKTYAMLSEARRRAQVGADVVVGLVDSHGRPAIEELLHGFELMPRRRTRHREAVLDDLDVEAVLRRRPDVVLVDELAHTNAPGTAHEKRWQDVEELLDAGIDVITDLNVSHLDSLNDAVEAVSGVPQHETVPDRVVAAAEDVELIDLSPQQLRARVAEGTVLQGTALDDALGGYYTTERLTGLRDIALGWLTDQYGGPPTSDQERPAPRVVAALTGSQEGRHVVRRGADLAAAAGAELVGVHVREPSGLIESRPVWLEEQRRLLAELGGRYAEVPGVDVAQALLEFSRVEGATHIVLGTTRRNRRDHLLHGSVIARVIRSAGSMDVHVVGAGTPARRTSRKWQLRRPDRRALPRRRRQLAWVLSVLAPAVVVLPLIPVRSSVGVGGALFAALLAVVAVAAVGGVAPAAFAIVIAFVTADFFFTVPFYSLRVDRLIDVVALIAFAVVASVVGVLVDILSRQGMQVAGSRAEAESLARLTAEILGVAPQTLPDVATALRRSFSVDAVSVLSRVGQRWHTEFSVGEPLANLESESVFTAEIADERVLVLSGRMQSDRHLSLVQAFVNELRHRRERDQLARLDRS